MSDIDKFEITRLNEDVTRLDHQVHVLKSSNARYREALVQIQDADKCNFSADGVSMAVRIAKEALESGGEGTTQSQ